jgi:hypothetical protein
MTIKRLSPLLLLLGMGCVQFAIPAPSLSQTDLNAQLRQALCSQNWQQALQILDQMKREASPEYAARITLYRGRIAVLARENVNAFQSIGDCSAPAPSAPANIDIPPVPSNDIPPVPDNIAPPPNNDVLPVPGNVPGLGN